MEPIRANRWHSMGYALLAIFRNLWWATLSDISLA
jgi:hypothetical protein